MAKTNRTKSKRIFGYIFYILSVINISILIFLAYYKRKEILLSQARFSYVYANDKVEEYSVVKGTTKIYLRIKPVKHKVKLNLTEGESPKNSSSPDLFSIGKLINKLLRLLE